MGTAILKQNFQDWLTQQWVILFGEKINTTQREWLLSKSLSIAYNLYS